MDNGSEFFSGSERKKKEWNEILGLFEAEVYKIPAGAKQLMGIVENSHRADDESNSACRCVQKRRGVYEESAALAGHLEQEERIVRDRYRKKDTV